MVSMKDRRVLRAEHFGFDLIGGGTPAPAGLVRIDPDGTAAVATEDLWFPNGTVITDDGTLIVAETFAARFTRVRHPARRVTVQPARLGPGPAGPRTGRHGDHSAGARLWSGPAAADWRSASRSGTTQESEEIHDGDRATQCPNQGLAVI